VTETSYGFEFGAFALDRDQRVLRRGRTPVPLNARYFDALVLLVSERGSLVTKQRFMEQVWGGIPVTDEALTQCIRTLRKTLGDDARRPGFIETVPKHGYRFIAPVRKHGGDETPPTAEMHAAAQATPAWDPAVRRFVSLAAGGALGGVLAGLIGGLVFGTIGAFQPGPENAGGTVSVLVVLLVLTVLTASVGGSGVALGIAAASARRDPTWPGYVVGGCLGGLVVGALAKLLILDAFQVVAGRSPGDVTGAIEGSALGAALGLAAGYALLEGARRSLAVRIGIAAGCGGLAGGLIAGLDGRLMADSLDLLARSFPESTLRFDAVGRLFGEQGFGPVSQIIASAAEGALFGACVVGMMLWVGRRLT